jgi:hypothetical protein
MRPTSPGSVALKKVLWRARVTPRFPAHRSIFQNHVK